ncbi:GNAT family N-acetyltransferase [Paracoccus sp. 1_MG-2023]|uniref:GNAT family N-acetyltransferase n=1 Tax=unclassified Paracoccus (in: a-proteobacteria) TaxID=2688777 RepID=UPI001C09F9C7|nr:MULTISPECIES: GNAT family N-acetyltransferase [unclassified Paracoccus (in: a-proteobacteria)]MBU2957108.1 GNAT family N-acetyltransferase [Paracoccus sp. C2R09]MDO6669558.1 GNAT family N-acetyltransferase [Paracoccus sp. 1_MG-2023]
MTDAAALAATHAACFTVPRPWSAAEFDDLLAGPGAFLLGNPRAFLLGRALAGEAELLTLAVDLALRRRGIARELLAEFADRAARLGAEEAFLEVAADNVAARSLYLRNGWVEAGLRPRYYGPATDAIVMRSRLETAQQGG